MFRVPETRLEWAVFLGGLAVIGALLAIVVFGRAKSSPSAASTVLTAVSTTAGPRIGTALTGATTTRLTTTSTAVRTTTTIHTTTTTTTATTTATTTGAAPITLRLAALQDTWFSVRRGSSSGAVLYEDTLTAGESKTFTGTRLWVRFGAASNVSATLDGQALTLPGGTYSVPITSAGLGARSG